MERGDREARQLNLARATPSGGGDDPDQQAPEAAQALRGSTPHRPTTHHGSLASFFEAVERDTDEAGALLRSRPAVGDAIASGYGLPVQDGDPELTFDAAHVLSLGRRTVLVKAHTRARGLAVPPRPVVLKLIKPHVRRDSEALAELEQERRTSATRVLAYGRGYLISEFAPGQAVLAWLRGRQWLQDEPGASIATDYDARIDAAADIGEAVCSALVDIRRKAGASHGNLSFSSVMVHETAEGLRVHLVDAGAEFRDAEQAEPTDAPRLLSGEELGGEKSDAYALGVILLQVLSQEPVRFNELQPPLANAWTVCPELARVIEDLTDANPAQRLLMLNQAGTEDRWEALRRWIAGERRLARLFRPSSDILEGGTSEASISTWSQVRRYFAAAAEVKLSADVSWPGYDLLKYVNLASYALWVLCLTGFLVLTSADIGLSTPAGTVSDFINRAGRFEIGDFAANFPPRLLALSFSYAALAFYSRVLASVTARGLGVPLVEIALRSAPLAFQLPAVWVIFYDPSSWPVAATAGVLATAVVNGFIRNLDRRALHAMKDPLNYDDQDIEGARLQRVPYRSWSRTSALYLFLMIVFDFLLYRYDVLKDAWFYAVGLAIGANYYVLYWNSIRKLGAVVHGSLQRSTFILRRAARVTRTAPSAFAASAYPGGVISLGPAAAVLSVALAAVRGEARDVEVSIGCVALIAFAVATAIWRRSGDKWQSEEGNTRSRVCAVAAFCVGLWLVVIVGGRFLFDSSWTQATTALVGAAAASTIAYWVLQAPSLAPLPAKAAVPADAIQEFGKLPESAFASLDQRRTAAVRLLDPAGTRPDVVKLERQTQAAWTQSLRLGRAIDRLAGLFEPLAFPDAARESILRARADVTAYPEQTVWEWQDLSPTRRAECSLRDPAGRLGRVQTVALRASAWISWSLLGICSVGFIFYAITDIDWERTPERFLALTYCIAAVAFQQILVGWVSVLQVQRWSHLRRTTTESAFRLVPLVFQGPAVAAIFVSPDLWPLWATIGIGSTAIINFLMHRFVRESLEAVAGPGPAEQERVERELASRGFSTWWITACAYTSFLVAFDLLITATDKLYHDRGFLAFSLAAGANLYVIAYNSLHRRGKEVRGQVIRAVVTLASVPASPTPATTTRAEDLAPAAIRVGGPVKPGSTLLINTILLLPFCWVARAELSGALLLPAIAGVVFLLASMASLIVGRRTATALPTRADVLNSVALAGWIWGAALLATAATAQMGASRWIVTLSPLIGALLGAVVLPWLREERGRSLGAADR